MFFKKILLLFICSFMFSCGIHIDSRPSNCTITFTYVQEENNKMILNEYSKEYTYSYTFKQSHVITKEEYDNISDEINMRLPPNGGGYFTFSGFYSDLDKSVANTFCPGYIVDNDYTFYYTFYGGPILFNLTIIDKGNNIFDKPTETSFYPYSKITLHSYALYDADLYMKVNGIISYSHKTIYQDNEVIWEYELTISSDNTVVEFIVMTNENYLFLNSIIDVSLDKIVEGRIETQYIGIAPGSLTDIHYSKDKNDIFNLYEILSSPLIPIEEKQAQITGGGSFKATYFLENNQYEFYFNNNNIKIKENYYHLNRKFPTFSNAYLTCHSFITYNTYTIYSGDETNHFQNIIVTKDDLSEIEFVETSFDESLTESNPIYYCDTGFGILKILSSKIFSIVRDSNIIYYSIVGTEDFSFLYL